MIKKILNEHGSAVALIAVIAALVVLAVFIIGSDNSSVLGGAIEKVIDDAQGTITHTTTTTTP